MNEYKMLVSLDFNNLFNALIKDQYFPTEETKKELDRLSAENTASLIKTQNKNKEKFVKEYGEGVFYFIETISDKYFLVGKSEPFYLSWNFRSDENDDYWSIRFYKGEFEYVMDICGGYGGTEVLEKNISTERVLELLKTKE